MYKLSISILIVLIISGYSYSQNIKQVTFNSSTDGYPTWSPDGKKIAFQSSRGESRDIWILNLNNDSLFQVTTDINDDVYPSWSPNGKMIAFSSNRDGSYDIWVALLGDSVSLYKITKDESQETNPCWSPDGKKIAFASDKKGNFDIWIAVLDIRRFNQEKKSKSKESKQHLEINVEMMVNITNNPARDTFPKWSPQGNKIAFQSDRTGNSDIWTIEVDNYTGSPLPSTLMQITSHPANDGEPTWSSDGSIIAFTSNRSGYYNLYVVPSIGGKPVPFISNNSWDYAPAWYSSEGKNIIAFQSDRTGNGDIYIVSGLKFKVK